VIWTAISRCRPTFGRALEADAWRFPPIFRCLRSRRDSRRDSEPSTNWLPSPCRSTVRPGDRRRRTGIRRYRDGSARRLARFDFGAPSDWTAIGDDVAVHVRGESMTATVLERQSTRSVRARTSWPVALGRSPSIGASHRSRSRVQRGRDNREREPSSSWGDERGPASDRRNGRWRGSRYRRRSVRRRRLATHR